jgi:lipid-binding SYLF domain-containing protein
MKMASAGAGLGIGVKDYRLIFVFENEKALSHFRSSSNVALGRCGSAYMSNRAS